MMNKTQPQQRVMGCVLKENNYYKQKGNKEI